MNKYRGRRLFSVGMLSVALIGTASVGILTSYALFSDEAKSANHVTAGTLELEFKRTKLFGLFPNEQNGILEQREDTTVVDLKTDNSDIITITNAVPGMSITAEMELTNKGSVAFDTYVEIVDVTLGTGDIATASLNLSQELDIYLYTLNANNEKVGSTFKLSEYNSENDRLAFALINKEDSQKFYVEAKLDESVGNEVQNGQVSFDVHVTATQKTSL